MEREADEQKEKLEERAKEELSRRLRIEKKEGQSLEDAMRDKGVPGREYTARVVLTVDGLDVEHVVTGKIKGRD